MHPPEPDLEKTATTCKTTQDYASAHFGNQCKILFTRLAIDPLVDESVEGVQAPQQAEHRSHILLESTPDTLPSYKQPTTSPAVPQLFYAELPVLDAKRQA